MCTSGHKFDEFNSAENNSLAAVICPFIPQVLYIFTGVVRKLSKTKRIYREEIAILISEEAGIYKLPPFLAEILNNLVLNFIYDVVDHRYRLTEQVFKYLINTKILPVFFNGKQHFYLNQLPADVLNIKTKVLFWLDIKNTEFL